MSDRTAGSDETDQDRIERERRFWDEHAGRNLAGFPAEDYVTRPEDRWDRTVPWLPYIGFPHFIQRVLDEVGDVAGKAILDLGSGSGFLATLMATQGATVDGIDVSDASLDVARHRAALSGVADRVRLHNMPVEELRFPDQSFDRVTGVFLLHHLDLHRSLPEIHRVLKPGGVAAFIETWGRNKVLMAARATLPGRFGINKAGSDDEAPLSAAACRIMEAGPFRSVEYAFPDVLFFRMAGYMRWAQRGPLPALWTGLDAAWGAIPAMRSWSYHAVVILRK